MPTKSFLLVVLLAAFIPCTAQSTKPGEVAPGIVLPTDGDETVMALDAAANGPMLVHIPPHEVVLSSHAASNLVRGMVYMGPHSSAELDGVHAPTILASTKAVFFVRIAGEDAEIERSRVHVLWLQHNKKRREITDFSMNIFGGQRTRNVDEVPADMEMVPGTNWLKVTPKEPLLPGEFAVAFLPKDPNQEPTAVFDFSVPGDKESNGNPYAPNAAADPDTKKS